MLLAGALYLWNLFKDSQKPYLQSALLLMILYSPDWTYAVVFFGISYEHFAGKKWFQAILLVFLACLLINNLDLFRKTLEAISAFA